jgi:hypothetical protein
MNRVSPCAAAQLQHIFYHQEHDVMEAKMIDQSAAHRRKVLIAGAAGLGETETLSSVEQPVSPATPEATGDQARIGGQGQALAGAEDDTGRPAV